MALINVRCCDVFGVKNNGVHPVRITVEVEYPLGWQEVRKETIDLGKRARARLERFVTKGLSKPGNADQIKKQDGSE